MDKKPRTRKIKSRKPSRIDLFIKSYKQRNAEALSKIEQKYLNPEKVERKGKLPKYYPTEDALRRKRFLSKKKKTPKVVHKLKSTITPGTVLILLNGKHRGRHCIFLKQLENGLLLVTGPFQLNRIPLKRVNQRYVIATKTKIDISNVDIPERVNAKYFRQKKESRPKRGEGDIFETKKEKPKLSEERRIDQKLVDKQLAPIISKTRYLKLYLKSKFSLGSGDYPHKMVF